MATWQHDGWQHRLKVVVVFGSLTLGACNNSTLSGLDRGHVSVSGLVTAPSAATSGTVPTEGQGSTFYLQSRQTLLLTLTKEQLAGSTSFSLVRSSPSPAQTLLDKVGYPEVGSPSTHGPLTVSLDAGGTLRISGQAGAVARSQGLVYGKSTLTWRLYNDDTLLAETSVPVVLQDFAAATVALTSFTASRQVSQDGNFQGWLAPLTTPVAAETGAEATNTTYLQSGFFSLINP